MHPSLQNFETLPEEFKKVIFIKYAGKPFAQLTELEQTAHSLGLLLKINVVTGWPVPESDESQNILAEQLKLYLIENWPLYNVDEIMYAMRSYAVSLNNWGKNMNLTLIGAAMVEYEKERSDISAFEESKANKPQEYNLLTMPADWKELCEAYYQDYLNNRFVFSNMPWQLYDEFVKCNMMDVEVFEDFFKVAKTMLEHQLRFEISEAGSEKEQDDLRQKLNAIQHGQNDWKITQQAKKLAVEFLYKTAKEQGFKNLFVKT